MTIEDQFSEALQQVLQDNPGISQAEAERIASQAVTPAGEPDRYVNEQVASLGGFIGDPAVPGSNRFSTAVQPNGTSSWTSGPVAPAGTAFNVAGDRWSTAAAQRSDAGASAEDVNAVINVPAQAIDKALITLAGAWDVPKGTITALRKKGDQALEDSIKLINSGMNPGEAQTTKLQPFLNEVAGVAAEYKHREALKTKEDKYAFVIEPSEFGIGQDKTAHITPTGFAKVFPYLPESSRTNAVNMAYLRAAGYEDGQPPVPDIGVVAAGTGTTATDSVVIMQNPAGQSVKVPQSQVARARQLGYR